MKVKELFDVTIPELKLGDMYDAKATEKAINTKKIGKRAVTLRDTKTGKVYGQRTIMTKE